MTRVPLRPALADLPPYVPGARVPVGAAAFKLSSNENPYPPLPSVVLAISDAAAHYHVPLLTTPWSYTTYRGS